MLGRRMMRSGDSCARAGRPERLALLTLALVLSGLGAPSPSFATIHHVAPNGSDSTGDGSVGTPWREIRRALTVAQPGDTILAADGSYKGFTIANLGSISSPIVIQAAGDGAEILPTTDRGGQFDPDNIAIWDSTNIVIDGFRSFNAKRAALRIVSSDLITVRNGVYGNNQVWAVVTTHSNDVVVESCDLYGSREQHGIYFANSGDRPIARGNRIHHNFGSGIRSYGDIEQGGDGLITGALFEGNVIYGNYGGAGMNLNAFKDAVIRNNLIYDNHASSGIALFLGEGGIGVGDVEIYQNTIDVPADGKYNLRLLGVQAPITLRNNILYNRAALRGIYSWGSPGDAAGTDGDFNVVAGTLFVSDDDEVSRTSWADWQSAGNEPSSFVAAPAALFADLAGPDYRLSASSPALDTGTTLASVPADLADHARPSGSGYDIGAYERFVAVSPGCGDGIEQAGLGEQCDDGNPDDGDCCSATCQAEASGSPCAGADVCLGAGTCDGAGSCESTAPPACTATFQKGLLLLNEVAAGKEKLSLKLSSGPALSQADFGDPVASGGTGYTLCLYDDADAVVGRLELDRAGDACGSAACWKASGKPPIGKGFRYKDRAVTADGVQLVSLKSGAAGKPKLILKGKNDAGAGQTTLPVGLAAALADSTTATLRLLPTDTAQCFSATLDTVVGGSATLFKAQR